MLPYSIFVRARKYSCDLLSIVGKIAFIGGLSKANNTLSLSVRSQEVFRNEVKRML